MLASHANCGVMEQAPPLLFLHPVEPIVACSYYVWACILLALEVSTELQTIPGDEEFEIALQRAAVSTEIITLTRIADGCQVRVPLKYR